MTVHSHQPKADALVALKCMTALPKVVDFLDEPDPAAPFERTENGVTVTAVREMVKLNHNRNCLLCHAPASADERAAVMPYPVSQRVTLARSW